MLSTEEARKRAEQTRQDLAVLTRCDERGREITCETCDANNDCDLAFDVYNTDGDCLALK